MKTLRDREGVTHQSHKLEYGSSSLPPATNLNGELEHGTLMSSNENMIVLVKNQVLKNDTSDDMIKIFDKHKTIYFYQMPLCYLTDANTFLPKTKFMVRYGV